ncbi:MAG: transcription antitermination factor NusB [Sumerlaeia bacterium]
MGKRRISREAALQVAYAREFTEADLPQTLTLVGQLGSHGDEEGLRVADDYASAILAAMDERESEIEDILVDALTGWTLDRLGAPDRAVLRVAVGELLAMPDVPVRVLINEYIELARRFGDTNSARFVNGVLDRVCQNLGRKDAKTPRKPAGRS